MKALGGIDCVGFLMQTVVSRLFKIFVFVCFCVVVVVMPLARLWMVFRFCLMQACRFV